MKKSMLFLLAVWLVSACATNQNTVTATSEEEVKQHLLSGRWELEELGGGQINDEQYLKAPFFTLDTDKGKVTGNTSCNSFFGDVTVGERTISFTHLGSTKMFCEKSVEKEFLDALAAANSFELKGTQLYLYNGDALLARLVKGT